MGRCLVTRELVEILSKTVTGRGGELWLTDAIGWMIKDSGGVASYSVREGQWFTIGHPHGYRAAFLAAMRLEEAGFWDETNVKALPLQASATS
jgi:UTP-glucose-1-phosphate uridylyltransferase